MPAKTVAEKLLVKPGTAVWISEEAHRPLVEPLPEGARHAGDLREAAVAVFFAADAATARRLLDQHRAALTEPAVVWVAYPKGNKSDINRDTLWPIVGEYGLRPNGQVAVDEVWSALRFRPLKEGEPPFTGGRG
ncbi:unnamed protein product [[Actinomadura] parvosata subsp. kistnae]|uniref:DUF3052 domain-containing protein n=1 Tax=[Actinomadura] parvosata subsp. kistnae TaxID=1909395 RepID=A0A1U9ZXH9_9ACTN|nr:hypothetical protein [Nonomuraea sp. ATCC 55076]AQZ62661.1 hypothetical protein BKM31_15395 [Nonomuraea sp. ATCC 55076]SPL88958.1 unnamed protein product [Actinomadura parvosata subsp. kistnae]